MTPFLFWSLLATLLLLLAAGAQQYRRRLRDRGIAQSRIAFSEARLKLSLWASGDELWSVDLDSGALVRENPIPELKVNREASAQSFEGYLPFVHPDDLEAFQRALKQHLRGSTELVETVYRSPATDGSWRWLQSRGRIVERHADGRAKRISGITSDVTQIKRGEEAEFRLNAELTHRIGELESAQAAIRAGDEKLMLALWGSDSEYWEADLQAQQLHRFSPLKHLMGASEQGAVGIHDFHRFIHPDDLEAVLDASLAHVKDKKHNFDVIYRARRADGRWAWLRSRGRVSQRSADGRALLMVGITFDVSKLKRTEEELLRLNEGLEQRVAERTAELSRSNEQLSGTLLELRRTQGQLVEQEKLAALGGLVAGIAHEINTPLGIGVTAASHLREQAQRLASSLASGAIRRSELDEFAQTAVQSSDLVLINLKRASMLVRSFKQVAVDQASEERRVIDLKLYLEEILLSLKPTLKKSAHRIELHCPADLSWNTWPGALYQIVVNLLMNALNHAWPDPLQEPSGCFSINASREGQLIRIEVADDGCGMTEEVRKRIFEPFFTTRRGQGGSGLGLHIVFNLVNQVLRGNIEVFTGPGQGTRFVMLLPMVTPAPANE